MFTLVLPFYRDTERLERTVDILKREGQLQGVREVLLCHNGCAQPWERGPSFHQPGYPAVKYLHTPAAGIGAGYRLGIRNASQAHIILSASDLPFGFSDLVAYRSLMAVGGAGNALAVGSKFHPKSEISGYGRGRTVLSGLFQFLRALLFPFISIHDTQGTLLCSTEVMRALVSETKETGYLFSLELILEAHKQGKKLMELPVSFAAGQEKSGVRVIRDGLRMAWGLLRLRARYRN